MKFSLRGFFLVWLAAALTVCPASAGGDPSGFPRAVSYRNVIVMVPDGCAQSVQTAARWYKAHVLRDTEPLALDRMGATGMVKTFMANSVITGSAAAATAFATGYKTTARFLSVGPDPAAEGAPFLEGFSSPAAPYAPLMTVLEGAKAAGKAVGLVSTSRITHATPAAFACHVDDRGKENEIMEHLVHQDVDVVFGGGGRHLIPQSAGGKRTDGEDLAQVLAGRGYRLVGTTDEMADISGGKVWGMFAAGHMEADIDRAEFAPNQPSLSAMAGKAIELLSRHPKGFFLVVEGSQVDWAGHANDPIYMITDFLAFDAAVARAMAYADRNPDTLILVFPDHNTGALSIGHGQSGYPPGYTGTGVEDLVGPLRGMKITSTGLVRKLGDVTGATVESVTDGIRLWWGLEISDGDAKTLLSFPPQGGGFNAGALSAYISKQYTVFGWTTPGHTGEDVPLWSYGRKRPAGLFDNTELAGIVAAALRFPLMGSGLWEEHPDSVLDTTDIDRNPVATVDGAEYPVGKDIRRTNGEEADLLGITVYAPKSGKVYIPLR